jgi:hypothetical protein
MRIESGASHGLDLVTKKTIWFKIDEPVVIENPVDISSWIGSTLSSEIVPAGAIVTLTHHGDIENPAIFRVELDKLDYTIIRRRIEDALRKTADQYDILKVAYVLRVKTN